MKATKEETVKQDILNKAQELFKQFGLKKTTMDEIAAACGKAKSTLYHYFKNKEEVFDEVLIQELHNIRKVVKEKVGARLTLQDKIKSYFIAFHTEAINKININRVLQQGNVEEITKFERYNRAVVFEQQYIESILLEAYYKNEYKGIPIEDIPLFSEILVVSFLGLVKYSVEKDQAIDQDRLSKFTDMLIPRILS